MLQALRTRGQSLKRVFAVLFLAYLMYTGYLRCVAIVQSDRCLDSGGTYDATTGVCRHGASGT